MYEYVYEYYSSTKFSKFIEKCCSSLPAPVASSPTHNGHERRVSADGIRSRHWPECYRER